MKSLKIFGVVIALILIILAVVKYMSHQPASDIISPKKNQASSNSATPVSPERIPKEIGAKPVKNPKDGSIKIVEEFVKANAKNPATFKFLEWSEISSEGGYWKIRCKYSGISSFNAEVTTNAWFYIRNNKVVYTKIISKI